MRMLDRNMNPPSHAMESGRSPASAVDSMRHQPLKDATQVLPLRTRTRRLELIEVTPDLAQSNLDDPAALARMLDVEIASTWPPEHWDPDAIRWLIDAARKHPDDRGWFAWYVVRVPNATDSVVTKPTLIGAVGCKGPPDANGVIEIGYGIASEHQRRGYAAEATTGLANWALRDARVKMIVAETFPHLMPSLGVMRRLGMKHLGDGSEAGTVRYGVTREEFARFAPAHASPGTASPANRRGSPL